MDLFDEKEKNMRFTAIFCSYYVRIECDPVLTQVQNSIISLLIHLVGTQFDIILLPFFHYPTLIP